MTDLDRVDEVAPEKVEKSWLVSWLVWIGLGLILEIAALVRKGPGDTLSAQIWAAQNRLQEMGAWGKIARWSFIGVIVAFLVWLIPHWALGII